MYDYKWNPTVVKIIAEIKNEDISVKNNTDSIAENMLLYQRSNGGWSKHFKSVAIDYKTTLTPADRLEVQNGFADGIDATIYNNATTKEIKYLAKAYKLSKDKRYLTAAEKGIEFLLKAQYPNGGWPQYYSNFSSYRSQIIYNDKAMVNVLNMLVDVVEGVNNLEVINLNFTNKIANAVQRAIVVF